MKEFVIIAGPCVLESLEIAIEVGNTIKDILEKIEKEYGLKFRYIFKSSFDKANRTSLYSYRGPGLEKGLEWLKKIKEKLKVWITTDVHETWQVKKVAEVVDVIQIPAFLCRQTDLLVESAKTGKIVNIKKGQFMSPWDMKYAVQKVLAFTSAEVWVTERGTSFGYRNLVVDFRSIPIMKEFANRVIFDATHSVQLPGGGEGRSEGDRHFIPYLIRAGVAVGADGIFMEVHPEPEKALCDGPNSLVLKDIKKILYQIAELRKIVENYENIG